MPEFVACPACGFRVQMADAVLGRRVRCLNCDHRFVAGPAADFDPTPQRIEPLPARPPDPAPPRRGGPPPLPPDDLRPFRPPAPSPSGARPSGGPPGAALPLCPLCGRGVAWHASRCPHCGLDLEPDWDRAAAARMTGRLRRDAQDHRGGLIAALGNLTLLSGGLSLCLFGAGLGVALPLGITTWVMANHDLERMRTGEMDPGPCLNSFPGGPPRAWAARTACRCGRCQTEGGRVGAITGIVLGVVFAAGYVVLFLGRFLT
jgi:hypothetical protein